MFIQNMRTDLPVSSEPTTGQSNEELLLTHINRCAILKTYIELYGYPNTSPQDINELIQYIWKDYSSKYMVGRSSDVIETPPWVNEYLIPILLNWINDNTSQVKTVVSS